MSGPFLDDWLGSADGEQIGPGRGPDIVELARLEVVELYAVNTAGDRTCNTKTHFGPLLTDWGDCAQQPCLKDERKPPQSARFPYESLRMTGDSLNSHDRRNSPRSPAVRGICVSTVPLPEAILARAPDSLPARVAGVVYAPRTTFTREIESPRWLGVLALTTAVTFVSSAALLATETGRLALVDQWERTALAFGQPVDDARYAMFHRASEQGAAYAALTAVAAGPLLVFGTSMLLFAVFSGMLQGKAHFRQVVAITAYAGVILALRQVIAAPLDYARETFASPATANLLFTSLDEASPLARFLGVVDLFVVWWASVLAIGIAVLYRRRTRTLVFAFIGAYLALASLLALVMGVTGGTA